MLEIKNKDRGPIQLVMRSRTGPRELTTKIIPGIGAGKNVVLIEDELIIPEIVQRLKDAKLITTRYISNKNLGD